MVTGNSALQVDLSSKLQSRMPWFIAAVLLLSLLVLIPVFRSVWVPLKAAALNLVSIGASYGVLVAIFQWGWGAEWFGIHETMPINPLAPMLMFAILFGLSMDYEVFLLGRVREEYRLSRNPRASLIAGVTSTAPVITSAALIMISVFYAFVLSPDITSKLFGLGLGTAVLLDVTLVRMVLVPAAMSLLGHRAWHLPVVAGPDPARHRPGRSPRLGATSRRRLVRPGREGRCAMTSLSEARTVQQPVQPTHHEPKRSREQTVALVAITAIGLVVIRAIDDAFLQPSAGVGHTDHLLHALASVVIGALMGAVIWRTRRGLRTLTALLAGGWGLVGSLELFLESGPRGGIQADDVSGILSLVAGAVLVCTFVYFACVSVSRGRRKATRVVRRGATAVGLFVAAYAIGLPLGVGYMATHYADKGITAEPDLGVPSERVEFASSDGLQLTGWYAPTQNGAVVLVLPGRSGIDHARMLARQRLRGPADEPAWRRRQRGRHQPVRLVGPARRCRSGGVPAQ